jgi:hypothetical protein
MVKSPQESGTGTTAADRTTATDRTAMADCTGGVRVGEPAIVAGPGFGLAGLV